MTWVHPAGTLPNHNQTVLLGGISPVLGPDPGSGSYSLDFLANRSFDASTKRHMHLSMDGALNRPYPHNFCQIANSLAKKWVFHSPSVWEGRPWRPEDAKEVA